MLLEKNSEALLVLMDVCLTDASADARHCKCVGGVVVRGVEVERTSFYSLAHARECQKQIWRWLVSSSRLEALFLPPTCCRNGIELGR